MDDHRLRFETSLALHTAVAQKVQSHPEILARARSKVQAWLERGGSSAPLLGRWRDVLDGPLEDVIALMTERSEEAAWLRKASPFAGALEPRERERILRETRERLESAA